MVRVIVARRAFAGSAAVPSRLLKGRNARNVARPCARGRVSAKIAANQSERRSPAMNAPPVLAVVGQFGMRPVSALFVVLPCKRMNARFCVALAAERQLGLALAFAVNVAIH